LKIKNLYIELNFFYAIAGVVTLFVLSFFYYPLYNVSIALLLALIVFTLLDIVILFFTTNGVSARRVLPEKLSNGDDNKIEIHIRNQYIFPVKSNIIDEIPFQFQKRDFKISKKIDKN